MEDLFAAVQPGNDGGASTPPAPEPPTPPAAEPPAPETPPAPDAPAEPTAEEKADIDEWNKVAEDMFGDVTKKVEDLNDDGTKKTEEAEAGKGADQGKKPEADAGKSDEADEKKDDDGEAGGASEDEPTGPPELSAVDRQNLEASVKAEISQKMFTEEINGKPVVTTPDGSKYFLDANGRPMLADADGDPIRGIDDIMKLVNPRTGQPFTEEQAGMWLLNANQKMRDNITDMATQINEIASTGITMKEESEVIAWQYGELLKAMPDLQKELWADYEKTLVKDPKTGIVTKAPVSLAKFYERALQPYATLAEKLEADAAGTPPAAGTPAAPATPPAPDKGAEAAARAARRADRSDIYGGGKTNDVSDDDKEWGQAAQAVFGDQLNDLRRK